MELPGRISILLGRHGATRRSRTVRRGRRGLPSELCCVSSSGLARGNNSSSLRISVYSALKLTLIAEDAEIRRGPQRKTVSLVVDSWCPRLLTLFVTGAIDKLILLGFLTTGDMAWRLLIQMITSQRVRVALVTSSPPRMPLEVFARLPFGTPFGQTAISVAAKQPQDLRAVVYFPASDAVSSGSPDIHRWLSGVREAQ
jgi:hypothetical protein